MRSTLLLAASLLSFSSPLQAQNATVGGSRLLDVETGRLVPDAVVRIENGVIVSAGPRRPGETVTHDLGDATLVPGLADVHVHLAMRAETGPYDELIETTARAAVEGVANARKTLEAGFTTVRDLGSRDLADVALRDAIAAGSIPGPRMLVSVVSLSATGGHADKNELPPDVALQRLSGVADGAEEIRRAVRRNVKYGADWIKVLATGGVTTPRSDPSAADYSDEELRAAVAAAREKGRDVAAHAHGTEGILRAVRAGVRSVEHASLLTDEAIAVVKASGVFLVPNPYTSRYILERGAASGFTEEELGKSRRVVQWKMESLKKAIRAGISIAYGTDSGVQGHGLNARQFAILVEAGMTPLQAIQTATLVAARLLRMEPRIGKLAAGFFGDVVAVRGNPLEDVKALESPLFVMKEGRVVLDRR